MTCRPLLILLCLLALVSPFAAQRSEVKKTAPPKDPPAKDSPAKGKPAVDLEAERNLAARRGQARSLLLSLASDALSFRDQVLRARSLARIADALWTVDNQQGRSLFRKAWDAAELADVETDRKNDEEIRKIQAKTGGGYAINLSPKISPEVLRLAARRDRVLGEEFLEKLKVQKQESANATAKLSSSSSSEAISQRLGLAEELLGSGNVDQAIQFADPVLGVLSVATIDFLSSLREKNPGAADSRYKAMLANAASNMQSDANTVSLLSSYIFTPHLYLTFHGDGISSSQKSSAIEPANVAPELRAAFLQTGAGILLRPLPQPEQDRGTIGIAGRYLAIKRLLPVFEQYAPAEMTAAVRGQLDVLNALVSNSTRQREDEYLQKGLRPEPRIEDQEQSILDRIERAKTSAERDGLYFQLAYTAYRRGDLRAREFVDKIEDLEFRKQAKPFVDASLAIRAIEKKEPENALELARIGDLTHILRTWILTQSAQLLAKTDLQKALDVIEDAGSEARRIDGSDPDRPRALLAVANALLIVDRVRVWDMTFEAVKAANSAEGFTGEDGSLSLQIQSKGHSSTSSRDATDFDVAKIFGTLADEDYDRAVDLARGFRDEAPRAAAVIAIARAVIAEKKK
jgi:hypothetical protein